MSYYTIHEENYETLAKLGNMFGTFIPCHITPALEYPILVANPVLGPLLVRTARASTLIKIDVQAFFSALLEETAAARASMT